MLAAIGINRGTGRTSPVRSRIAADANPSWRWDERQARAHCTCTNGHALSIFDVLGRVEAIDFDAAKIRAAELIGRNDLIEEKGAPDRAEDDRFNPARSDRRQERADAAARLPRPPAERRA